MATKLFSSDFSPVCQGATQSRAKAYDKAAKTGHKVILFATHKDTLIETTELPSDWTVMFNENTDAYASIDLVACAVRTSETFVKDCTDYKVDDQPTNNIAKLYDAEYKLTVREATTGKELASTDLLATEDTCPMFVTFEGKDDTVEYYTSPPKEEMVEFIKPFVQP